MYKIGMNYLNFLFFSVLMMFAGVSLQGQTSIPSTGLKSLDGQNVELGDYIKEGQITVLSFWATWCAPCKRELDAISEYYSEWQTDYNVELIAISVDDARSVPKIKGMVAQKKWPFTILSDVNQSLQKSLNFQTVPQTFLIDKQGKIVWSHSGYSPGDEIELESQIKLIAEKG